MFLCSDVKWNLILYAYLATLKDTNYYLYFIIRIIVNCICVLILILYLQDPFLLNRCIINVDREMEDIFEVMELNKESCLFKVKKYLAFNFSIYLRTPPTPVSNWNFTYTTLIIIINENFFFQSEDSNLFKLWLQNVKQQTLDLGTWRKRRNALPNIMIKHLVWFPMLKSVSSIPMVPSWTGRIAAYLLRLGLA